MSSDYNPSLHNFSLGRQHSLTQLSDLARPFLKLQDIEPSNRVTERYKAAVESGQNMPLKHEETAEKTEEIESAVSQISDFVQNYQRALQFSIDTESDRLIVKVVDSETQEVIRQIPSEEMLRIARNLDSAESLIFREQA
ncbi:MAG: flagellar protein FlaG [Thiogranum sp.]|nr:flagellar protein FlaG [Thiogranum sp.]